MKDLKTFLFRATKLLIIGTCLRKKHIYRNIEECWFLVSVALRLPCFFCSNANLRRQVLAKEFVLDESERLLWP